MKNRSIKFRIYKSETKEWIDFPALGLNSFKPIISSDYVDGDYFVIQQYTGLHDKNSKEIYEGDLLRDDLGLIYEVFWLDTSASFEMVCRNEDKMPDQYVEPIFYYRNMYKFEIIGNIFETPNLLK